MSRAYRDALPVPAEPEEEGLGSLRAVADDELAIANAEPKREPVISLPIIILFEVVILLTHIAVIVFTTR